MLIYYIIVVVNLHVSVTFCGHLQGCVLRRVYYKDNQTNVQILNTKFKVSDSQYILKFKIQIKLLVLNLHKLEVFMCCVCVCCSSIVKYKKYVSVGSYQYIDKYKYIL